MSFAVRDVIWMVIGGSYGVMAVVWGVIVWRSRPWGLDLLQAPIGSGGTKTSQVRFPN